MDSNLRVDDGVGRLIEFIELTIDRGTATYYIANVDGYIKARCIFKESDTPSVDTLLEIVPDKHDASDYMMYWEAMLIIASRETMAVFMLTVLNAGPKTNTVGTVELDYAASDIPILTEEAVLKSATEYAEPFGCTAELMTLNGPGGGNSLVRFNGPVLNMMKLLWQYCNEDGDTYYTHIQAMVVREWSK